MPTIEMPDVNVLIALFDPEHIHHNTAQDWFSLASQQAWCTCPLTENGFLRIVSKPNYPGVRWNVAEAAARLAALISNHPSSYRFYADSISLCDSGLFNWRTVQGSNQLTDLYLLGLCQQHHATLVTFDSGIRETVRGVIEARHDLVRLLVV